MLPSSPERQYTRLRDFYPIQDKQEIPRTLRTPALRMASEPQVDLRLRLGKLLYLFVVFLLGNALLIGASPQTWLNWYLTLVWSAYVPITLLGMLGAIASQKQRIYPYRGKREEQLLFIIPTIARGDTLRGLYRAIDSILLCAPEHFSNFEIHLLVEEGAEGIEAIRKHYHFYPQVFCLVIPASYQPPNGTRYKARANQYGLQYRRQQGLCGPDVFVYHSDDDTSIGHDTIWSIAHFIEKNTHDLAQGLLTYPHQLTRSWFCRLADSIRPTDDMSRFYFCTGVLGSPLAGLHGEHLLIRASVEDQIGWDFGPSVKVEDAYFGLLFAKAFPGRSTFLPSCSYGASPASIRDLVTQRRRWAAGLIALLLDPAVSWKTKPILCYSILNWTIGLFQHIVLVLLVAWSLHLFDTSPVFSLLVVLWVANFSFQIWMYLEGLRMNLEASQAPHWQFLVFPLLQVLSIPVLSLVEAASAILGLLDYGRGHQGFTVISKRY